MPLWVVHCLLLRLHTQLETVQPRMLLFVVWVTSVL